MTSSDTPSDQTLTRRQMRELRATGALPVITPEAAGQQAPESNPASEEVVSTPEQEVAETPVPPKPADPVASAASEGRPLTRREAREQERIRTASVPVLSPVADESLDDASAAENVAEVPVASEVVEAELDEGDASAEVVVEDEVLQTAPEDDVEVAEVAAEDSDEAEPEESAAEIVDSAEAIDAFQPAPVSAQDDAEPDPLSEEDETEAAPGPRRSNFEPSDLEETLVMPPNGVVPSVEEDVEADESDDADSEDDAVEPPLLRPGFGEDIREAGSAKITLPPSFDDLIARNATATGSMSVPNALILSQTPTTGSLTGPVTATGDILVTGTFALPDGIGSQGHAYGTTDGKDVDAVLVDGELPASSSPTPIAASAAVSQVKAPGDVIKPPAPEKTNKLPMVLAITAGALTLGLGAFFIYGFSTGLFS